MDNAAASDILTDMETSLNVYLTDVRHGSATQDRDQIEYATLVNAVTGETLITATMSYIMAAIIRRNYMLIGGQ